MAHPLDPLSASEIQTSVSVVRQEHQNVFFNIISLHEPRKAAMTQWLEQGGGRPRRIADVCVIAPGGKVGEGLVDVAARKIVEWNWISDLQPIVRLRPHCNVY